MHSARFNASKSILAESIQAQGLVIGASAVTERDGVLIKDACSSILQLCACRFSLLAASTLDFSSFQATNASKTRTYFQYYNISILKLYAALSGLEDTESNMNGCTFVEARKRLMQRSLLRPVGRELRRRFKMGNCAPRIQGIRMMQMERRYQCFVNQGCECASERQKYCLYTCFVCQFMVRVHRCKFSASRALEIWDRRTRTCEGRSATAVHVASTGAVPWPNMMSVGTYKQAVH